jgi:putative MATE family efflux protein
VTKSRFLSGMRKSIAVSTLLSIAFTVVLTLVCCLLSRQILVWMQIPDDISEEANAYMFVVLLGTGATVFYNMISNMLRALGDSKTPLYFLVFSSVLNIILDIVFIVPMHMGVAGAAWATILSQFLSAVFSTVVGLRNFPILHLRREDFHDLKGAAVLHLKTGFPMGFQMSIIAIGSISVTFVVNTLGTAAVAAFTSSVKIENIVTAPLKSFGAAMSAFVGQNYGAGKIGQAKEGVKKCLFLNIAIGVTVGALVIIFYEPLTRFFIGDNSGSINPEEVLEFAKQYIIVTCSNYWILATIFVLRNSIQGLGNSFVPTIAGVGELVMRVAGVFCLSPWIGFLGASIANPMAWLGSFIPLTVSYVHLMRKLTKEGIKAVV